MLNALNYLWWHRGYLWCRREPDILPAHNGCCIRFRLRYEERTTFFTFPLENQSGCFHLLTTTGISTVVYRCRTDMLHVEGWIGVGPVQAYGRKHILALIVDPWVLQKLFTHLITCSIEAIHFFLIDVQGRVVFIRELSNK